MKNPPHTTGQKPVLPKTSELEGEIEQLSHRLVQAQRANSAALNARVALRGKGDEIAIAANRREIADTAEQIRDLTDEIECARQDLAKIKEIDRSEAKRATFERIRAELGALLKDASACEDSGSPKDLAKVRDRRRRVYDELSLAGIAHDRRYDAHIFNDAVIVTTHELQQWLDSGGVVGRGPGLDTPEQLRQSGRASLRAQANAFRAYTLRIARLVLEIYEPNEAA
jgi:hypothetical protein